MNLTLIAIIIAGLLVTALAAAIVFKRMPRKLNVEQFVEEWKSLQAHCKDKTMWSTALKDADALFDKALKRRKFKGKSMGERMVSAQRSITNNDQLWFAHNLAKKVIADPATRLKEADVKAALIGFRQALKDVGALASPVEQTSSATVDPNQKEHIDAK